MVKKKKVAKKSQASFKQEQVHSDKLSAYKGGSLGSNSNKSGGPENRADKELKHMMTMKKPGLAQGNRRNK